MEGQDGQLVGWVTNLKVCFEEGRRRWLEVDGHGLGEMGDFTVQIPFPEGWALVRLPRDGE
jgi:hypothetical protein